MRWVVLSREEYEGYLGGQDVPPVHWLLAEGDHVPAFHVSKAGQFLDLVGYEIRTRAGRATAAWDGLSGTQAARTVARLAPTVFLALLNGWAGPDQIGPIGDNTYVEDQADY